MKTLRRSPEVSIALHTLKVDGATPFNRLHMFLYSLAIVVLIYHRSTSPLLFLADLQLAFMWATSQSFRWRSVHRREFLDRLIEAVGEQNLPGLDVFVCTADPEEPPISVVLTTLSAMAFDYPPDRISLYVSDDGGSELTLFAFMEAAKFARHWLPFCRQKRMLQRSPEVYFASDEGGESDEMKIFAFSEKLPAYKRNIIEGYTEYEIHRTQKSSRERICVPCCLPVLCMVHHRAAM